MSVTLASYSVKPEGFIGVFQILPEDVTLKDGDYAIVGDNLIMNINGTTQTFSFKGTVLSEGKLSNPLNGDLVAEVQSSATVPPYDVTYKNYDGTDWQIYTGPVMNLINKTDEG